MSTDVTFDNFRAFVERTAEETPEREINHVCWDTCAVGDFAREVLKKEDPTENQCMALAESMFGAAFETPLNRFMASCRRADTYGEFRDELDNFLRDNPYED